LDNFLADGALAAHQDQAAGKGEFRLKRLNGKGMETSLFNAFQLHIGEPWPMLPMLPQI
jgi:hypothetical protein